MEGAAVWDFAYSAAWKPLFAAAISRSNNIQGDPEKDGRTQDIVGLQLVEKLAPAPRAWHFRPNGQSELAILVVDGALTDTNFAVQTGNGILSAQLYEPRAPMQDHFSDLAWWITDRIGRPDGSFGAALFISQVLEKFGAA
jgi:hypothetical protein